MKGKLRKAIGIGLIGIATAGLVEQLRHPATERTWRGRILGIPYDYRPPTVARLRESFWNPDDPHLFTSRVLGVGWSINFYRLLHLAGGAAAR